MQREHVFLRVESVVARDVEPKALVSFSKVGMGVLRKSLANGVRDLELEMFTLRFQPRKPTNLCRL